jgi:hypothetical protein
VVLDLDDATNLRWSGSVVELPHARVQAHEPFTIDWEGLADDLWGNPAAPEDVGFVQVFAQADDLAPLYDALEDADLVGVDWWTNPYPLYEHAIASTSLVGYEQWGYVESMRTGEVDGLLAVVLSRWDGRVLDIATLSADGDADTVALDGSASVAFTVDPGPPLRRIRVGTPVTLSWEALSETTSGLPVVPTGPYAHEVFLARIPGATEPEAAWVNDPEAVADAWYSGVPSGDAITADALVARDQTPFPGFDAPGTWFVGVRSSYAMAFRDVPEYLGTLEVIVGVP